MREAIRALFLSSLAASVAFPILMLIYSVAETGTLTTADLRTLSVFLAWFFVVALLALLLIAVPLTFILSRHLSEREWIYLLAGFVAGCAVALLFAELPLRGISWLILLLAGGLPGSVAGYVWWIAYRRDAVVGRYD